MAPQIIYLILVSLSFGIVIQQHGEPKKGKVSAWSHLFGIILTFVLLYWGGFFDVFF
jgi:hypothetical protein